MQAMVFDLDGTVIDTMDDLVALTNQVLDEFNMPRHSKAEIQSYVGNGALALMLQAVPPGTPEDITSAALTRWKELNPQFDQLSRPYPGISETLEKLRREGVRIALLSNKFDYGVQVMVNAKLPNVFEVARGERPDTPRKPDPTGLSNIFRQLEADPALSAYVGDSPGDIQVAKNAGCLAVGVSWGYRSVEDLAQAGADVIVDCAEQLLDLIETR